MSRHLPLTIAAALLLAHTSLAQVVINEIFTGDPDWIEIANVGTVAEDISGWQIAGSHNQTIYPIYTVPQGIVLVPGAALLMIEGYAQILPGGPTPPPGALVVNMAIGLGWVGTSSGAVVLADAQSMVRDYLLFGTGNPVIPALGAGQVFTNPSDRSQNSVALSNPVFRHTISDTGDGADWTQGQNGDETPGYLNPGQGTGSFDVARLVFAGGAVLTFDPSRSTFAAQATVASIVTTAGLTILSSQSDGLVGGTVTLSGHYVGNDTAGLGGLILAPTSILVRNAAGTDTLLVNAVVQSAALSWELSGGLGAIPQAARALTTVGQPFVTRTGSGSQAIGSLNMLAQTQTITLFARLGGSENSIAQLEMNHVAQAPVFASELATDGFGTAELGVINAQGDELYNVFAINSALPLGAGALFGIEFGAVQFAMCVAPLGTAPFHVTHDIHGAYAYGTPIGTVPPGTVVDYVAIDVGPGILQASQPKRVSF
jgi:hypothetical protein